MMSTDEAEVWVRVYAATKIKNRLCREDTKTTAQNAVEDFREWQAKQQGGYRAQTRK